MAPSYLQFPKISDQRNHIFITIVTTEICSQKRVEKGFETAIIDKIEFKKISEKIIIPHPISHQMKIESS